MQLGLDDALAQDIGNVEQVVVLLLGADLRSRCVQERPDRCVVDGSRRHRDELLLRISQGRQLAAKDTPRIDVHRPVEPFRLRHRRVAIHHHRLAAVFGRPVQADRQTKFVRLARGLAVHGEIPDLGGTAPLHLLLHAGVGHHESTAVKNVMTHQAIQELRDSPAEVVGFATQLPD